MRLRQRVLDPRALVWISSGVFLTGYIIWELLECGRVDHKVRQTNSSSPPLMSTKNISLNPKSARSQDAKSLDPRLPRVDVSVACAQDFDRCNVFGFHLGVIRMSVHIERIVSGLHSHEPEESQTREVSERIN